MFTRKSFFTASLLCLTILLNAQQVGNNIMINQLGYYPHAAKVAVITGDVKANRFYIMSKDLKDTFYTGTLSAEKQSANSSTKTHIADFSSLQKTGTFVVLVPGLKPSYTFTISSNVAQPLAVASLKAFYFIRASQALDAKYAGKWARAAGHPDTAVLIHASAASEKRPAGTVISTPGGWYDAGDYNKYIVNSGISTGTLLSAYEDFSYYFNTVHTNIPESNNGVPDILNEIAYNLRWMLTMQDPFDGGVYNKCTNAAFDGMVMPNVTKLPRYVVQKGTAATLDFAAVTAQASRIFSRFGKQLPGLSDSCMAASKQAWQWAQKNPALEYDQNGINQKYEPKIVTGGYGDKHFTDEWFWAAAELFVTTRDEQYYATVKEHFNDAVSLPGWGNVYLLGYYSLARNAGKITGHEDDMALIKKRLVTFADSYLQHIKDNAFETVMGQSKHDFNWGSNSNAANHGIALINAYLITKDKKYVDAALTNLDYIMGRNATGYCFVTGLGSKPVMNPHHRPSVADGIVDPVPGLMAGGPNPGMQDHAHYDFTEPETAYTDVSAAYASNEIAINWNAPLVYLSNALEALQYEVRYSDKVR